MKVFRTDSHFIAHGSAFVFFLAVSCLLWLSSCVSTNTCPPIPSEGNLGSLFNSYYDEAGICIFENTLYFSSNRSFSSEELDRMQGQREYGVLHSLRRIDGSFGVVDICTALPINSFGGTSPTLAVRSDNTKILIFSTSTKRGKKVFVDLFESTLSGDSWSTPLAIESINTREYWESQPALSPDATMLVFASDRPGGLGGSDLYVSIFENGTWGEPRNLGSEINTPFDELTPSFGRNGELLFATRGKTELHDAEICTAETTSFGVWMNPRVLPKPYNSSADDISPMVLGDSLLFASKRKGGCGGYDLYAMAMCAPVYLRVKVQPSTTITRVDGVLTILDSTGKFAQQSVSLYGKAEAKLVAGRKYVARYVNPCSGEILEQEFSAPCNDSKTVVLQTVFQLPELQNSYTISTRPTSFFTPGYYKLNTTNQLTALRSKFDYNLLGTADSTKYIINPAKDYDASATIVDSTVEETVRFIVSALAYQTSGCAARVGVVTIAITGFADSRTLSPQSKFAEETIEDDTLSMVLDRGATLKPLTLAKLRAYFTAKALQQKLSENPLYVQHRKLLQWRIEGKTDDEAPNVDAVQRKIEVRISYAK